MDARSIAATAANGGRITAATDIDYTYEKHDYSFDKSVYEHRIYYGYQKADPSVELILGPNITDWPKIYPLADNMLVKLAASHKRPCYDDGRAHSLRRDLLLSQQSAEACGVYLI